MRYHEALELLDKGYILRRLSWYSGMILYKEKERGFNHNAKFSYCCNDSGAYSGTTINILAKEPMIFIDFRINDPVITIGWKPCAKDIEASDWAIDKSNPSFEGIPSFMMKYLNKKKPNLIKRILFYTPPFELVTDLLFKLFRKKL